MPEVKPKTETKTEVLPGEDSAAKIAELEARVSALESAPTGGATPTYKKTTDPHNPVWKGWVPELQGHVHG